MCLRIATVGMALECQRVWFGYNAVSRLARCRTILCVARSGKTHLRRIDGGCGSHWHGRRRTCYAANIFGGIPTD